MSARTARSRQRRAENLAPDALEAQPWFTREAAWTLLGLLLLLVLATIAYAPVTRAGFIWDDPRYVTENEVLRDPRGLLRIWFELRSTIQYYPLVFTSFWFEYRLWELNPLGYHVVNVLLHIANASLLWLVLRRLRVPGSWVVAALFALHPVHVESVAWVTERKNVLSGFFYLAAGLAYLRFRPLGTPRNDAPPRDWRYYALALVFFLAALFSKTVTCSLPAAILLLIWWKEGRLRWRDAVPLIPFFVIGAALASVTGWMEKHHVHADGPEWDIALIDRCLIAGRALWFYVGKLVWPHPVIFNYPRWHIDPGSPLQWLYLVGAVALPVILWLLRWRIGRGPLVAALFFGGTLYPALGFVNTFPMRYSFVADHFQYLASIGPLALLVGAIASWCAPRTQPGPAGTLAAATVGARVAAVIAAFVVLAAFTRLTYRQVRVYETHELLWRDTIAKNPDSFLGHNNLGGLLLLRDALDEAEPHFKAAIALKEDFREAHMNLGDLYLRTDRPEEALAHYERYLAQRPDHFAVRMGAGIALANLGRAAEAVRHFRVAARVDPRSPLAQTNLANALAESGARDEALAGFDQALKLNASYMPARRGRAFLLAEMGQRVDAINELVRVVRELPNDVLVRRRLAELLAEHGMLLEAAQEYRQVLLLTPDDAQAAKALSAIKARLNAPP